MFFHKFLVLFYVFGPVGQSHVSLAQISVVHGECSRQAVVGVSSVLGCVLHVVEQKRTIVGMGHLDKLCCFLHGAFSTQVGHAVFRDDGIYEMARMVDMGTERHDTADGSAFGGWNRK